MSLVIVSNLDAAVARIKLAFYMRDAVYAAAYRCLRAGANFGVSPRGRRSVNKILCFRVPAIYCRFAFQIGFGPGSAPTAALAGDTRLFGDYGPTAINPLDFHFSATNLTLLAFAGSVTFRRNDIYIYICILFMLVFRGLDFSSVFRI